MLVCRCVRLARVRRAAWWGTKSVPAGPLLWSLELLVCWLGWVNTTKKPNTIYSLTILLLTYGWTRPKFFLTHNYLDSSKAFEIDRGLYLVSILS